MGETCYFGRLLAHTYIEYLVAVWKSRMIFFGSRNKVLHLQMFIFKWRECCWRGDSWITLIYFFLSTHKETKSFVIVQNQTFVGCMSIFLPLPRVGRKRNFAKKLLFLACVCEHNPKMRWARGMKFGKWLLNQNLSKLLCWSVNQKSTNTTTQKCKEIKVLSSRPKL